MNDQKKQRALTALVETGSLSEASERAGISRRTLYNYLSKDHDFAVAYQETQEQIILSLVDDVTGRMTKAMDVIMDIMQDENVKPETRLRASESLLSQLGVIQKKSLILVKDYESRTNPDPFAGMKI